MKRIPSTENQGRKIHFHGIALAIVDTVFYDSPELPLKKEEILEGLEEDIGQITLAYWGFSLFIALFNLFPLLKYGKTFIRLSQLKRFEFLKSLMDSKSFILRTLGNAICLPFKFSYVSSPDVHESMGIPYRKEKIKPEPESRWMRQIFPASSFDTDETIEADVVVVGTGAGGAVVAKELAEKGLAVAIIEAGHFYRRDVFTGNPKDMIPMTYRNGGITATIGNAFIPLQMGKAVGGTTLINSATCFRTPDDVLNQWVTDGLTDFSPEKIAPYFERVEEIIHVQECEAKYIGPIGEVIKQGCDKFGYSCGPLKHNTIDCEGEGVCTQGCPKDAKQSTNLTYIPKALNAAAQLFTGFEVKDILTNGDRAIGIKAFGEGKNGRKVSLTCFAKATVLSCGTLITPTIIQKNHLVRGNKWIGKNLTIHPAIYVGGIFPDKDMKNPYSIPQGYMIDEFHDEGLMFEGGTPPFMIIATVMPGIGKEYIDMVSSYHHLGIFGCMAKDTSTGFVRPGIGDLPFIFYYLNKKDTENLIQGMTILGKVFFAAGAKKLFLSTFDHPIVERPEDLEEVKQRRWTPKNLLLSAYHAVGTAKIGLTGKDSAIDTNHQCHNVPGLFVVDGSSIPTSLGVNPQVTIMALATRAAEKIAKLLD
ncbi:MAG: GMC family oxidoreductase [Deltaproteobacteria bacterium]|nr:GMC family oxidoreductase [Deltaproteobacteria bacterium]